MFVRSHLRFLIAMFIFYTGSVLMNAAYYAADPPIGYSDRLSLNKLLFAMTQNNFRSIREALAWTDLVFLLALLCSTVVAVLTRLHAKDLLRTVSFCILPILLWRSVMTGLVYLIMFPMELTTLDGEWIGVQLRTNPWYLKRNGWWRNGTDELAGPWNDSRVRVLSWSC